MSLLYHIDIKQIHVYLCKKYQQIIHTRLRYNGPSYWLCQWYEYEFIIKL